MASSSSGDNFPSELSDRLTAFDDSLTDVDTVLQELHALPLSEIHEKASALDKARLDIIGAYAMNSLFWMYLVSKGENPRDHGVRQELDRVRRYMDRVKEVQEKIIADQNRPKVNKEASKRFVRSALWQAAKNKVNQGPAAEATASETPDKSDGLHSQRPSDQPPTQKRPGSPEHDQAEPKKKKKKKKKNKNKN